MAKKQHPTHELAPEQAVAEPETTLEPEPVAPEPVKESVDYSALNSALMALLDLRIKHTELALAQVTQRTSPPDRKTRDDAKSLVENPHLNQAIEHLAILLKSL